MKNLGQKVTSSPNLTEPAPKKQKLNSNHVSLESSNRFTRKRIQMDGNCLYRAILYCLEQNDESHYQLREELYTFVKENKKSCYPIFKQIEGDRSYEDHIETILQMRHWGGLFELKTAAKMLQFNYIVYRPDSIEQYANYSFRTNNQTIYLEWENFNHFNSLIPNVIKIDLSKTSSILQNEIENSSLKCDQDKFEKEMDKKLLTKEIKKVEDEYLTQKKTVGRLKKQYPPSKNDGDMYNKVFAYLNYRINPSEISKEGLKDFKKYVNNHYRLEKESTNKYTMSRLKFIPKNSKNIFTIPYLDDIPKIFEEAHGVYNESVIKHNGILTTQKKILSFGLSWCGMNQDIKKYINSCKQCINQSRDKPCNVAKVIEPTWPLNRIVADNWTIPKKFLKKLGPHQNYKYVLTCVDHFSKFKWCFLIPNKEPKTILERLEIVFSTFSKPDIFQSDNGTEFKNPLIKGYCEKKKIKFINGRVRHPQSQGVVEKINDFVAKSLKSSFEAYLNKEKLEIGLADEKEWWGIETALLMFVANQNSKVHTVTNFPPNELVNYRNINNEHLKIINQVKEKIYSYYAPKAPKEADTCKRKVKSKNKRLPNLKIGMKVFMIGEIKKDEKNMAIVENTLIKKLK